MASKFDGDLKYISPNLLITEKEYNRIESFFLGLGMVFNDLKGLILFEKMLIETYEKPQGEEITCHAGNYCGILVQIHRLIASTINEFFVFLKKNDCIFSKSEFKEVIDRLSLPNKKFWSMMVAAAHNEFPNVESPLKMLVYVRSNIAFPYDHSGKILRNGYISRFFGELQNDRNKFAYYSIDDNIELTRFYFSDAAAEEVLYISAGKKPKENNAGDNQFRDHQKQVRETIEVMSAVILALLKNYIQIRRNKPR